MKRPGFYIKKLLKILSIFIGILIGIIILLSVVAKLKEKEITNIALKKIGESIHIPIAINDISFNLLRRFPLATIELDGVRFGSPDSGSLSDSLISKQDALASIERIYVSVKSRPLFKGEFDIMKVEIKGLDFSYIINKQGISNFDFLIDTNKKDSSDSTSVKLSVLLKELLLKDVYCTYYDSLNQINAEILIPKAEVDGALKNEYIQGSAKGALRLTHCNFKASNLKLMNETEIDFDLAYSEDSVDVKELIVITDGATIGISGNAVLKDTIETDLHVFGNEIIIGELVKYVPQETLDKTGLQKITGLLNINASIRGFVSDSILPEVNLEFAMQNGHLQKKDYPALKNVSFNGDLTNGKLRNNISTSATISNFHAETDQSSIDLSGSINNLDRIQYQLNTSIAIESGEFKNYIPDTILSDIRGQIKARIATKGILPDSIGSDFIDYVLETSQLDLTLSNLFFTKDSGLSLESLSGQFIYDLNHLTARGIQVHIPIQELSIKNASFDARLSGKISEPANMGIDLKSYQLRTDSSTLYGSANIRNSKEPEYSISSNIKLNLGEVKNFLPDTLVKSLSGSITAHIASAGKLKLDSIPNQINDLIFEKSSYSIDFNNVSVEMPDTLIKVKNFSGSLQMKPDTIKISNTNGVFKDIDFTIDSTKIVNLYNAVIKNQAEELLVEGRFNLGDLDYSMFSPFLEEKKDTNIVTAENTSVNMKLNDPDSITKNYSWRVKGKLGVKSFTYEEAMIDKISGLFNLTDSLYLVDQFKFNGFGGSHNTSVNYAVEGKQKVIWIKNKVEALDVQSLLQDFNDFSEFYDPAISWENITGILSARLDGKIILQGDSLLRDRMRVRGEIKLEKGGIYNYPPVQDVAKYLPGVDNLDKLEFKTINSNIFVFKDAINVPSTFIVSNKLDATVFGMKSFGEDYSYHLEVFLRDILLHKSKRRIEKQDEIGDEIAKSDREGTRVRSYSIEGKRRTVIDNDKDRKEMKRKIMASESLLNLRFNPNRVNYNTGVN